MAVHSSSDLDRFTWGFVLAALALCALAIASVFFVRRAPPPSLKTPAGVVAAYVQAVHARDADSAWDLLAPGASVGTNVPSPPGLAAPASSATRRDDFRAQLASLPQESPDERRIRIVATTEQAETARVTVEVTLNSGPTLFGGGYNQTLTFDLRQVDGSWKIDAAPALYEVG